MHNSSMISIIFKHLKSHHFLLLHDISITNNQHCLSRLAKNVVSLSVIHLRNILETAIILLASVRTIKINYFCCMLLIPKLIQTVGFSKNNVNINIEKLDPIH